MLQAVATNQVINAPDASDIISRIEPAAHPMAFEDTRDYRYSDLFRWL